MSRAGTPAALLMASGLHRYHRSSESSDGTLRTAHERFLLATCRGAARAARDHETYALELVESDELPAAAAELGAAGLAWAEAVSALMRWVRS